MRKPPKEQRWSIGICNSCEREWLGLPVNYCPDCGEEYELTTVTVGQTARLDEALEKTRRAFFERLEIENAYEAGLKRAAKYLDEKKPGQARLAITDTLLGPLEAK